MQVRTHFRHLSLDVDFDGIVKKSIRDRFGKMAYADDVVVELYVSAAAPRTESHGPVIECHMTLWAPWLAKKVFAKEISGDFWTALSDCSEAVKHQVDKVRDIRRSRRRHDRSAFLPDLAL